MLDYIYKNQVLIPVWCNWNLNLIVLLLLQTSFNSCMVQLKLRTNTAHRSATRVLIPLWGNWNSCLISVRTLIKQVLIPVWCNWNWRPRWQRACLPCCFNSCMVQLKLAEVPLLFQKMPRFNSCMVQLKYSIPTSWNRSSLRFNSCMVQLKLEYDVPNVFRSIRFNSCMVQLKLVFVAQFSHRALVLIPVWCNWNVHFRAMSSEVISGFNSCMVQLKLER